MKRIMYNGMMTTRPPLKNVLTIGRHKPCKTIKMCDNEFSLFHLYKWIIHTG